jgi:hypothetical protein
MPAAFSSKKVAPTVETKSEDDSPRKGKQKKDQIKQKSDAAAAAALQTNLELMSGPVSEPNEQSSTYINKALNRNLKEVSSTI